ncbi:MAG TPA: hypothetical protein DD636_02590 [Anaerolineaceae bacterium]|jgi:hypothetical protein|nr:hypothetical protein [Anaerolineaceae bacterium]
MFDGKFTSSSSQSSTQKSPKLTKGGRSFAIAVVVDIAALIIVSAAVNVVPAGYIGVVTRWGAPIA